MRNTQNTKEWLVKELSELTKVSVRTLHHYDKIGLLKPSLRLSNGYRLYSEADLLKLQQIIALKFLGFELSHIKNLMQGIIDAMDHFGAQKRLLDEKTKALQEASQVLDAILQKRDSSKSIPWETVIYLIEVYRMTKELDKSWAAEIFTPQEFKEYASLEADLSTNYTQDQRIAFTEKWRELVADINANLDKEPTNDIGYALAKRCMDMINPMYGRERTELRKAIWEKGFKGGGMPTEYGMSPESVKWLDQAMDHYYHQRIYGILGQVTSNSPSATVVQLWNDIMEEMCGTSQTLKDEIYNAAELDHNISPVAKNWLKTIR